MGLAGVSLSHVGRLASRSGVVPRLVGLKRSPSIKDGYFLTHKTIDLTLVPFPATSSTNKVYIFSFTVRL
jgi:hypothetical protein